VPTYGSYSGNTFLYPPPQARYSSCILYPLRQLVNFKISSYFGDTFLYPPPQDRYSSCIMYPLRQLVNFKISSILQGYFPVSSSSG